MEAQALRRPKDHVQLRPTSWHRYWVLSAFQKQQLSEQALGLQPSSSDLQPVLYFKGGDRLDSTQSHREWLYSSGQKQTSPLPLLLDCVATDALLHIADLSHPIFN